MYCCDRQEEKTEGSVPASHNSSLRPVTMWRGSTHTIGPQIQIDSYHQGYWHTYKINGLKNIYFYSALFWFCCTTIYASIKVKPKTWTDTCWVSKEIHAEYQKCSYSLSYLRWPGVQTTPVAIPSTKEIFKFSNTARESKLGHPVISEVAQGFCGVQNISQHFSRTAVIGSHLNQSRTFSQNNTCHLFTYLRFKAHHQLESLLF